jgi:hypothetical protein
MRNHEEVVAVVGHIHDAGIGHTFLSCIKATNGMELWRINTLRIITMMMELM